MNNIENNLWQQIEKDKNKYTMVLFVSAFAWFATIAVLSYIGYLSFLEHQMVVKLYNVGIKEQIDVFEAKKSIVFIVFASTMIVACLMTVVVFMRQRSASLHEIQMRLAMVEQHIEAKKL